MEHNSGVCLFRTIYRYRHFFAHLAACATRTLHIYPIGGINVFNHALLFVIYVCVYMFLPVIKYMWPTKWLLCFYYWNNVPDVIEQDLYTIPKGVRHGVQRSQMAALISIKV